jgi:hypothetical protein
VTKQVIWYGQNAYERSGTFVSPMYEDNGNRYDWGFAERDLKAGYELTIRQATPDERVQFEERFASQFNRSLR